MRKRGHEFESKQKAINGMVCKERKEKGKLSNYITISERKENKCHRFQTHKMWNKY